MVTKIESLTPEQEAMLVTQRDYWLKVGLNTEPCDFEKSIEAAIRVYQAANLTPPNDFYQFSSPASAAIGALLIDPDNRYFDEFRSHVEKYRQVGMVKYLSIPVKANRFKNIDWSYLCFQLYREVICKIPEYKKVLQENDFNSSPESFIFSPEKWESFVDLENINDRNVYFGPQIIFCNFFDELVGRDKDKFIDQIRESVKNQIYGNHDASWLSFYDTFLKFGVEGIDDIKPLIDLAHHCGWWAPYDICAIFQDRPEHIKFDDQQRLHGEDCAAIRYRDGFEIYSWHGTRIPPNWIRDKDLDAKTAITWPNIEERRAACEILGWANVLKELNCKTVNKDPDPQIGELVLVDLPEIGKEHFLLVRCGTDREFALPVQQAVNEGCTTARAANAWTYGMDENEFYPEVRT